MLYRMFQERSWLRWLCHRAVLIGTEVGGRQGDLHFYHGYMYESAYKNDRLTKLG
jgi:hypothetical protein